VGDKVITTAASTARSPDSARSPCRCRSPIASASRSHGRPSPDTGPGSRRSRKQQPLITDHEEHPLEEFSLSSAFSPSSSCWGLSVLANRYSLPAPGWLRPSS
jgi:hypothetical protein